MIGYHVVNIKFIVQTRETCHEPKPLTMEPTRIPDRLVIHTRDVANIMGLGERSAQRILTKLKKYCGRSKEEFVTVQEFCDFYGLEEEHVKPFLRS